MSVLKKLLGETLIYGLSVALSSLVGFFLLPIYTRSFTPSEYGAIAMVNTSTTLIGIFVVFGLDNSSAIWFWEKPEPEERSRTFSTWLVFTTGAAAVAAAVALALKGPLAAWLLKDPSLSGLWTLFAANIVAVNVSRIGVLWYRMQRKPVLAVVLTGLTSVGTAIGGIVCVVKLKMGLPGVLWGQVVGSWVSLVATMILLRGVLVPTRFDRERLPPMLKLSAPLVLMTNLSWLMGSAITPAVNLMLSRADAGLYQVASSLASLLGLIIFAFDQAWAPFALGIRDAAVARRVYGVAVEVATALGLLLAFSMAAFALPILRIMTRAQYTDAQWVLAILGLNTVVANIPAVLSVTFAREKQTRPLAKATAFGVVVTALAFLGLAPIFGKEGAAAAVVLGSIVVLASAFRDSQKVFPIDVGYARLGLTLLLTAGWTVALVATRDLTVRLGPMIAHRSLLCVTLLAVVVLVYRGPLRAALAEGRAARAKAAAEPEPEGDAPSAEDAG